MNIARASFVRTVQEYSDAAMLEHTQRQLRFETWFDPTVIEVMGDIQYDGMDLTMVGDTSPVCTIAPCLNPRVKAPAGVIAVDDCYQLVNFHLRKDIWQYWRAADAIEPLPVLDPISYVAEVLHRSGEGEVVSSGCRGSRITLYGKDQYAFGFGSGIAAYVYHQIDGELDSTATMQMYARTCVRVVYMGCTYQVKVPHALESGRGFDSFRALAYGIVPLVHAYRTANDRAIGD